MVELCMLVVLVVLLLDESASNVDPVLWPLQFLEVVEFVRRVEDCKRCKSVSTWIHTQGETVARTERNTIELRGVG